jgi:hypothetical protein
MAPAPQSPRRGTPARPAPSAGGSPAGRRYGPCRPTRRRIVGGSVVLPLVALLAAGCGDDPTGPTPGAADLAVTPVSGDGQVGLPGSTLPEPLVVRAEIAGASVPGEVVTWVVVEGGGSVYAGTSKTDDDGYAREWWTLGQSGAQRVEVRAVDPTTGERRLYATFKAEVVSELPDDEPPAPVTGLVGHYRFDDGSGARATDATGRNHGQIAGGVWTDGVVGASAIELDGDGGHARIPSSPSLDLTGDRFTLAAWVLPRDLSGDGDVAIISKAHEGTSSAERYHLGLRSNGGLDIRRTSGGSTERLRTGRRVVDGEWQHVAAVYDGSHLIAYVNGEEAGRTAASGSLDPSDRDLLIGKRYNDRFFTGAVDDARIYADALSPEEIATLYAMGGSGDPPSGDEPGQGADVASIGLAPSTLALAPGETRQLEATALDADGSTVAADPSDFAWTSSDEGVATVSSEGIVTAHAEGSATISASLGEVTGTASVSVSGEESGERPDFGEWDLILADTSVVGDVVVPDGEAWLIGPNVEVRGHVRTSNGTIAMRPGSGLRFHGADPARYVGGGMTYGPEFADDIGLWVGRMGRLDISCTPKQSWNRTGTHSTWEPADEYWIAPTDVGDFRPRRWYPGDPIPQVDPRVPAAEVMNVTRDCVIEGPGHIHIHSHVPQRIEYVRLERMGVSNESFSGPVLGRYALHLHHGEWGTAGTVIRGVAAVNSGGRVFVPHGSHGASLIDNVVVNSFAEGLWWDTDGDEDMTNDILVDRLKVSGVNMPRDACGCSSRYNAIALPQGIGMEIRNSAASGAHGNRLSNGFHWDSDRNRPSSWVFDRGNVSHNNEGAGLRFWTNTRRDHVVANAVSYRDGVGIDNGAYVNAIRWHNIFILEAGPSGTQPAAMLIHANPRDHTDDGEGQKYTGIYAHSPHGPAMYVGNRNASAQAYAEIVDAELIPAPGHPKVYISDGNNPWQAHFIRSGVTPDDFEFESLTGSGNEGTHILIDHEDGRKWEIIVANGQKVVRNR